MSWDAQFIATESKQVQRIAVLRDRQSATYAEVIDAWRVKADFRAFFIGTLASAPYQAFFWETPPVTRQTARRSFEYVLVESPALSASPAAPATFAAHFRAAKDEAAAVSFWNLGGDALLVAPMPHAPAGVYSHIATFSRNGPLPQQHAFWHAVGAAMAGLISDRPLWLSTSGLGVPWLHARLDSRPKYYTFAPYRQSA